MFRPFSSTIASGSAESVSKKQNQYSLLLCDRIHRLNILRMFRGK